MLIRGKTVVLVKKAKRMTNVEKVHVSRVVSVEVKMFSCCKGVISVVPP